MKEKNEKIIKDSTSEYYQTKKDFLSKLNETNKKVLQAKTQRENSTKVIDIRLDPSKYKFIEIVPNIIRDKYFILEEEYKKKGIPYSPFLMFNPESLGRETIKKQVENFDYFKTHILLENYDEQPESYEEILQIMDQNKNENQVIEAQTKWLEKEGEQIWKPCEVVDYDRTSKTFTIKIYLEKTKNYLNKKVTRFNLLFKKEDKTNFFHRIKLAEKWIHFAKKYMAFYHFVNGFEIEHIPELDKETYMDKIFSLMFLYKPTFLKQLNPVEFDSLENSMKYGIWRRNAKLREVKIEKNRLRKILTARKIDNQQIDQIFNDINLYYRRSFKLMEFYKRLPLSYEQFELLKEIIPRERFYLPNEKFIHTTDSQGTIKFERHSAFLEVYKNLEKKLHQSDYDTSSLLIEQHTSFLSISEMCFFYANWYQKPIDLETYVKKNKENIEGIFKEIKFMIGNSNHKISKFIKERLDEAKKINKGASIPPQVINKFRCFQDLLNERVKNLTRGLLFKSINYLTESFRCQNELIQKILGKDDFSQITEEDLLKIRDDYNLEDRINNERIQKDMYHFQFINILKYKNEFYLATRSESWITKIKNLLYEEILAKINLINAINVYELSTSKEQISFYSSVDKKIVVYEENDDFKQMIDSLFFEIGKFFSIGDRLTQLLNGRIRHDLNDLTGFLSNIKKKNYTFENLDIKDFRKYININKNSINFFQEFFNEETFFLGGVVIKSKKIKDKWLEELKSTQNQIFSLIIDNNNYLSKQMEKEKEMIEKKLDEEPEDVDKYHELVNYCNTLDSKLKSIWDKIGCQQANVELLEENFYEMKRDEFFKMWSCYGIPKLLHLKKAECLSKLNKDKKVFKKNLKLDYVQTIHDISALKNDYETNILISVLKDGSKNEDYTVDYYKFSDLNYRIEQMLKKCSKMNIHQTIIGLPTSDFSDLREMYNNFIHYYNLWDVVHKFESNKVNWKNDPLKKIDRKVLKTTYDYVISTLDKLERTVFKKDRFAPWSIIQQLRERIKEFQPFLPILFDLINPDLKPAHILELAKQINLHIPDDLNISMKELIDQGIIQHIDAINERSAYATGQKKLASKLEKFKEKFKQVLKFDVAFFKDSDLLVFKDTEIVVEEIDSLLTKIVSMSTSKYAKYLQKDIQNIWSNLSKAQEIIDIWLKVQKFIQQQQQIFVYDDIRKQLPMEYSKYESIEKAWRTTMDQVKLNPFVNEVCSINKLKETLVHSLDTLEYINKQLNSYLNTKRDAFPRFYFVSNEELIIMLAQSGDPLNISNNYIQQIFEGIKKLAFTEKNQEIKKRSSMILNTQHFVNQTENINISLKTFQGMISEQGENVDFFDPIKPFDEFDLNGEKIFKTKLIERWLQEVEKEMRKTLNKLFAASYLDLLKEGTSREDWCCNWQEQAVLTITQLHWTNKVTESLNELSKLNQENSNKKLTSSSPSNPLVLLYEKERENLLRLIAKLKGSELSKNLRKTLVSLIIQDVHANDVLDYIIKNAVSDSNCFEWLSQLRYYYTDPTERKYGNQRTILVKMLNTERIYDFEYLGNQKRLVITQLTDRCYRTMMEALNNQLGGAPEGPAGTGKTETIKDLSKNLGKKCFTYNCSEESDYYLMTKFFKGVAMSGSWICFDEFNRISVDVLSVIAFQISTLLDALKSRSTGITFESEAISFNQTMAIFITMNPDYAGRSELPDNLKGLFRPMAMMIPDYAMITEIMLYSYGFSNARNLARKIVSSLKLASEQLSTQVHYDYGMRTLNGIINYIGVLNLKDNLRVDDEQRENFIVQKAIRDSNMPKFNTDDFKIYEGILSDLFPNSKFEDFKEQILIEKVKENMQIEKLYESQYLIEKILDFNNIMYVRHAIMIVGEPMASKSTILKLYLNSVEDYFIEQDPTQRKSVKYHYINPKSITSAQLYGYVNKTMEFVEGVCSKILKEFLADTSNDVKFIVFDGPVDTIWIENMNSLLDDTKKLCLANSDAVRLDEKSFLVFEIDDLSKASLATISRCGMLYTERDNILPKQYFLSWLNTLPGSLKSSNFSEVCLNLYENFFEPILNNHLFDQYNNLLYKIQIPMFKNHITVNFIKIFESLYFCNLKKADQIENEREKEKILKQGTTESSLTGIEKKKERNKILSKTEKIEIFNKFIYSIIISIFWIQEEQTAQKHFLTVFDSLCNSNLNNHSFICKEELLQFNKFFVGKDILQHKFIFGKNESAGNWVHLNDALSVSRELTFNKLKSQKSVLIPTIDTIKIFDIMKLNHFSQNPILFIGQTATGKTSILKNYLREEISSNDNNWVSYTLILNSRTTANNLCDLIEEKISFKLKKNTVAPVGNKQCLLLIDDLNMPAKEEYGAQPPIEILRQLIDYGGWFDRKEKEFLYLKNILLFSSMTTGRPIVSYRLIWHFIPIFLSNMDDVSLKEIFSLYFSAKFFEASPNIRKLQNIIVDTMINSHNKIISCFRPLPVTPHYCFSLRDLNKIVEGLTLVPLEVLSKETDPTNYLFDLMIHEVMRVTYDRLVDDSDREKFVNNILSEITKISKKDNNQNKLNFHDSMFSSINDNYLYMKVLDIEKVKETISKSIEEYNIGKKGKEQLDLILFDYSLKHILRIDRILYRTSEHGLLVGLSGSGRQSYLSLCASIQKFKLFKIRSREEVEEYGRVQWLEDIRNLFSQAGLRRESTIFVVRDTSLADESFYVDLNCLISSGVVYNLFSNEEKSELINQIKNMKESENEVNINDDQQVWDYFISTTMNRLRVFICMNPLDKDFQKRLRSFPALINNTTIDWYEEWPENALYYLAKREFSSNDFKNNLHSESENVEALYEIFSQLFIELSKETDAYFNQTKRKVIILPKAYLEFISNFKSFFSKYSINIINKIRKYKEGVLRIDEAELEIKNMKEILEKKKPELAEKSKMMESTIKEIDQKTKEASEFQLVCEENEKIAMEKRAEAEEKMKLAQESREEAEKLKQEINLKVQNINENDFRALRSYRVVAKDIVKVMQGLSVIMSNFEKKPLDPIPTNWDFYKKKIVDMKILKVLLSLPTKLETNLFSNKIVELITPFFNDNDLEPKHMEVIDKASSCFCVYLKNMVILDNVLKNKLIPSKELADKANKELKESQENLDIERKKLKEVKDKLDELNRIFSEKNLQKQSLEIEIQESLKKLNRAERLTSRLSGEKKRWSEFAENLENNMKFVFGDCILSVFYLTFLGPYLSSFRENFITTKVFPMLVKHNIQFSKDYSISRIIGSPKDIQDWILNGLPSDWASIDNALILFENRKPALLMDPQKQGLQFLTRKFKNESLIYKKSSNENDNIKIIEKCVAEGKVLIFDNINYDLLPEVENLISQETLIVGGKKVMRLSENNEVVVDEKFKYFLLSYQSNPVFHADIYGKVSLINFTVTKSGLTEQLLSEIYKEESPNEEIERKNIMQRQSENKIKINDCEEEILTLLNVSSEKLLDDDNLIIKLEESKKISEEALQQMTLSKSIEERIDTQRSGYMPLAELGTLIFFSIQQLSFIEHIYQFSISRYILNVILGSIKQAGNVPKANFEKRLEALTKSLYITAFNFINRSLINKDKIVFSFMILVNQMLYTKEMNDEETKFLSTDQINQIITDFEENSMPKFIDLKKWEKIVKLSYLENFKGLSSHIKNNENEWKEFVENHSENLPGPFNDLNLPRKLLILKIFHLEHLQIYIKKAISNFLANELTTITGFSINDLFDISTHYDPLLILLSPGIDPNHELRKIADELGRDIHQVSLGQGQTQKALTAIDTCKKRGNWVFLQNCHLVPDFMKYLEDEVNNLTAESKDLNVHLNFRLWMSALPSKTISSSVIINSLKISLESPVGIKSNIQKLIRSQAKGWNYEVDQMKKIGKEYEFSKFIFSLIHFHSIIIERKNYGSLGWNIKYNFNENDFIISKNILKASLEKYNTMPFKALIYLTADCIYGGRVTDDLDRRTLISILQDFYNEDVILHEDYFINNNENYNIIYLPTVELYLDKINKLTDEDFPEVVGLHENALTRRKMDENYMILNTLSLFESKDDSGSKSKSSTLNQIQEMISKKIKKTFNIEDIKMKYPITYEDSMNSILIQEAMRYNNLINLVLRTLSETVNAYQGLVPLTDEIDAISNDLNNNRTPQIWIKSSYPSKKPLGSWINDLHQRLEFFNKWITNDKPLKFWISGFFFTQSFLTGIKQNFARNYQISIDRLEFEFQIIDDESNFDETLIKQRKAYYIYGLYIEGARWNEEIHCLDELKGKSINVQMPPIVLTVKDLNEVKEQKSSKFTFYYCPVYKCSTRYGTLSTTGHSTNFIFTMELPSLKNEKHWIKRGVALLNQLDD